MPFRVTSTKGYDVNATKKKAPPGVNGHLKNLINGEDYSLWINDLSMGYSMSGSIAQSFGTRTLFPHNIGAVSLRVQCQFPNQELYITVIEAIRHAHLQYSSSLKLEIINRGKNHNQSLKGAHNTISAEGYIGTVQRAHNQHEYAPTLQFEFIVERFLTPTSWRDESVKIKTLKSWKEIIDQRKASTFVTNPDDVKVKEQKATTAAAQAVIDKAQQAIDQFL